MNCSPAATVPFPTASHPPAPPPPPTPHCVWQFIAQMSWRRLWRRICGAGAAVAGGAAAVAASLTRLQVQLRQIVINLASSSAKALPDRDRPGRARPGPRAAPTWAGAVLQLSLRTWNAVRGTWSCHMLFLPMPNMKMQMEMITKFITIAAMIVAMIRWRWRWRWLVAAAAAHFVIIFMWENVAVVVVVVAAASENDLRRGRSLINFNWLCWAGFHLQPLRASTSRLLQLQLLLLLVVVVVVALLAYCKIASTS